VNHGEKQQKYDAALVTSERKSYNPEMRLLLIHLIILTHPMVEFRRMM
jgi:hypothetical protein